MSTSWLRCAPRSGPDVVLQVDANGSYTLADADHLAALDALDVACLEQPLAPDALLDHARLAARLRTPIGLDETITERARSRATRSSSDACTVVSIKAGLVGGLDGGARARTTCASTPGVGARAGGMLETGVGRAALDRARVAARLHRDRRPVGVEPLLRARRHRAVRARRRAARRARPGPASASRRCPTCSPAARSRASVGGPDAPDRSRCRRSTRARASAWVWSARAATAAPSRSSPRDGRDRGAARSGR